MLHLAPLDQAAPDIVAVAEGLLGAPYLWGGKSVGGIDCSGLVQLAASMGGRSLPRDSDLQRDHSDLVAVDGAAALRRGDLAFWPGHVGVLCDAATLLHANAHHMLVTREPIRAAQARIAAAGGGATPAIRRFAAASRCSSDLSVTPS